MMTIYQLLPRLFTNRTTNPIAGGTKDACGCGKLNDIDDRILSRIRDLGITHIWYTGIIRHATQTDYTSHGLPLQTPDVVKGQAGSPYAIVDYYDVDPDLAENVDGRVGEWQALVDRTHHAGLKVVMDFVPNHVAREYKSVNLPEGAADLSAENFYILDGELHIGAYTERPAKATGNDVFSCQPSKNDWYETVKLNYQHRSTWEKMTAILLYWAEKGVDAFRCDMAEMVPVDFWAYAIAKVKAQYPQLQFIAEVYNPRRYREFIQCGFDYLYDKVGMYDCLRDVVCQRRPACDITWQWQSTDDIHEHMLYFLENHDEQRIASDYFCGNAWQAIPAVIVALLIRQNPFMLYMGQEVGEPGMDAEGFSGKDGRTTIFDYWSVDSLRRAYMDGGPLSDDEQRLYDMYRKLLNIALREKAVGEGLFFDLMYVNRDTPDFDSSRQFAFLRKAGSELLIIVVNFSSTPAHCKVTVPQHAFDYFQLPCGNDDCRKEAIDLLTDERATLLLSPNAPVDVNVAPYSGRIYKITLNPA